MCSTASFADPYHLETDPREQQNLIDQTQHAEVVQSLKRRLDAWWTPASDRDDTNSK